MKSINNEQHSFFFDFPNSVETPLWLTALFNIEHFSFVQSKEK